MTHSKACVDFQVMRVPQPITGIEVFKQRVSTHEVVLKVVDPISHNVHGDLLLADFSKVEWREWHCLNTKVETYFQPNYFSGFDDLDRLMTNAEWDRVDLLVRTVPKKGGPARTKRFGSLEDIQSFVVEEAQQESTVVPQKKRYERAKSTLRINLGNHLHTSDKIKLQAISFEARKFRLAKPRMKFTGAFMYFLYFVALIIAFPLALVVHIVISFPPPPSSAALTPLHFLYSIICDHQCS